MTSPTDSPTAVHGRSALTEANRQVMAGFVRAMYEERDPARAFAQFVSPGYRQHNPMLADGPEAAVAFLTPIYTAAESEFTVKRILIDGDLAAVHVSAQPVGRAPLAVADLYRLADGLIVEHWDVIQPVPADAANDNTMF